MNIDEYIQTRLADKVVRRANSPLVPLLITAVGVVLLVAAFAGSLSDSLQTALLTVGFLTAAVGVVWAALCLGRSLWHYHYLPTKSSMRRRRIYLSEDDYRRAVELLRSGSVGGLASLTPVTTSNGVLMAVVSRDGALSLLQAGRLESSGFEPATDVFEASGGDVRIPFL